MERGSALLGRHQAGCHVEHRARSSQLGLAEARKQELVGSWGVFRGQRGAGDGKGTIVPHHSLPEPLQVLWD